MIFLDLFIFSAAERRAQMQSAAADLAADPLTAVTVACPAADYRSLTVEDPACFAQIRAAVDAGRWTPIYKIQTPEHLSYSEIAVLARSICAEQHALQAVLGRHCRVAAVGTYDPAWMPQLLAQSDLRFCLLLQTEHLPADPFWWDGADGSRALAVPAGAIVQPANTIDRWFLDFCAQPLDLPTLRAPAPQIKRDPALTDCRCCIDRPTIALMDFTVCSDGSGDRLLRLAETDGTAATAAILCTEPDCGFYADFMPHEIKSFRINAEGYATETDFLEGLSALDFDTQA